MPVARGYLFHVLNPALAEVVSREEIGKLAHPAGFAAGVEQRLPEVQIGHLAGKAEAQLRMIRIDFFGRYFAITGEGALENLRCHGRFLFIVEKLHFATQEGAFLVEHDDLKAAAPTRQDVHSAIRIFAQHFVDGGGAAGIDNPFFVGQNHPKFQAIANGFADHFLVAILENMEGKFVAGQEHDLKRKKRQ